VWALVVILLISHIDSWSSCLCLRHQRRQTRHCYAANGTILTERHATHLAPASPFQMLTMLVSLFQFCEIKLDGHGRLEAEYFPVARGAGFRSLRPAQSNPTIEVLALSFCVLCSCSCVLMICCAG
jgi:hypothetical protein